MELPDKLRGHHLIGLLYILSLEDWRRILIQEGYVSDSESSFVHLVYGTYELLRNNPQHRLRIIEGDPDLFCSKCIKQKICYGNWPKERDSMLFLDNYFLRESQLISNKTYSVKDIIDNLNPNAGGWWKDVKTKLER